MARHDGLENRTRGGESWRSRLWRARPSRIGRRLLAFNLLLVFLPVAGILYLDVYETRLLDVQERGMVQQGRLVAAALGEREQVLPEDATTLLARLGRRGDARIRIYDARGVLLADSVRAPDLMVPERPVDSAASDYAHASGIRERFLYRVGAWLVTVRRAAGSAARSVVSRVRGTRPAVTEAQELTPGPEVRAALDGRYGADVRPTPGQRSLTLYSAVPIRHGDHVTGVALISQSTFRILQALYAVRLRIFEIVVASIVAATVLGLLVSATIVRPLVHLRRAAVALSDRQTTARTVFAHVDRADEIGDLARALDQLTSRLDAHIKLLESFAGDVSHEFKNPLASIRAAAETLAAIDDPAERRRVSAMLTRDVDRLERLVSGVRELARIDAQLAHEALAPVDVASLVTDVVDGYRQRAGDVVFNVAAPAAVLVRASADRLAQVVENLLDNAASFAPSGSVVDVRVAAAGGSAVMTVEDRGPGFPPGHAERAFERFFSYRPDATEPREHMGLGLSIARAIVEGYGGSVRAANRSGGGATVEVRLPIATLARG